MSCSDCDYRRDLGFGNSVEDAKLARELSGGLGRWKGGKGSGVTCAACTATGHTIGDAAGVPPPLPPLMTLLFMNMVSADGDLQIVRCDDSGHGHHERAKVRRSFRFPASAARIASRYFVRASPALTRSLAPHVNERCPSFVTSKSAIKRACLPLPLGNGWICTSR